MVWLKIAWKRNWAFFLTFFNVKKRCRIYTPLQSTATLAVLRTRKKRKKTLNGECKTKNNF